MGKIWMFYSLYQDGPNLESMLYAVTDDKDIATKFKEDRKGLICKERSFSGLNKRKVLGELKPYWIIEDMLWTRDLENPNIAKKVSIYLTDSESVKLKIHCDDFILMQLGAHAMNPKIFCPEIQEILNDMGMGGIYDQTINLEGRNFIGETISVPLWKEGHYVVDELALLLRMVDKTFIKEENKK